MTTTRMIINVIEHSSNKRQRMIKALGLILLVAAAMVAALRHSIPRSSMNDKLSPTIDIADDTSSSTRMLNIMATATQSLPTKKPTLKPVSKHPTRKPNNNNNNSTTGKPTKKISNSPTMKPSLMKPVSNSPTSTKPTTPKPLSKSPTYQPAVPTSKPTTRNPTTTPTLSKSYFNYNTTIGSQYGPAAWGNVSTANNYWSEFGFTKNQCSDKTVMQSPIDVCTSPEKHCLEYHEPRSHGGNFRFTDQYMTKRILPNKLHLHVVRKVANQTIPPSFDFASTGAKSLDLLNIDIKFPSEHTVCGRKFDGEMQYYFYHPVKKALIVVAWLFEVKVSNLMNQHMQRLIDEFQEIYDVNEEICRQKKVNGGTTTMSRSSSSSVLAVEPLWNPFHRDIQKTIHFWGYSGSLTEPPCAGNTLWRIMDVPVPLSMDQLNQMQNILFNNRDSGTCAFTSNQFKGSVARPINDPLPYYKCTRQDYKSDDERELCGDKGCDVPFSTHLDPWIPPIVYVTAPPSFAPTDSPL